MSSYSLDHSLYSVLSGSNTDQLGLSRQAARRSALVQALSDRSPRQGRRLSVRWVRRRARSVAARPA